MSDEFELDLNSLINKIITSLTALQSTISDLYRKKTTLIEDVRKLRYQRELLLKQKPKIKSEYEDLSQSKFKETTDYGKEVGDKLAQESTRLAEESNKLDEENLLLADIADYYTEYASILSLDEATTASRKADLDKRARIVARDRTKATELLPMPKARQPQMEFLIQLWLGFG